MKKYFFYIVIIACIITTACTNIDDTPDRKDVRSNEPNYVININTTRSIGNILGSDTVVYTTRAGNVGVDPFTEIREVQSFESVVLSELQPHIWIGNIMTKGSIINCVYKPLIYPRSPITISLTLPGTASQSIAAPSYSKYLAYIQAQTAKGTYVQNNEFNFTVEQFTSYNELKTAFGSNVNTNGLFWHSSTTSSSEDHLINKATGLYVKFYQTSFKAIMDYPEEQIASIPDNMIDSAVYINSITYGRLGILTIETNESVSTAQAHINKIFKTIFYNSSSSFSKEEQEFLNGCEFKVYLIGGNGSTSVESFTGLDGFIQHIKKGSFSKSTPGTPIFCTFNHVLDNSPVSVNFRFSVKREPLYVEMVSKPTTNHLCDLYLYFYKNKSKIPTIAHPSITFLIKRDFHSWDFETRTGPKHTIKHTIDTLRIQNAGYQTSIKILSNLEIYFYRPPISRPAPHGDHDHSPGIERRTEILMLESPNNEYKSIGLNPINHENTKP